MNYGCSILDSPVSYGFYSSVSSIRKTEDLIAYYRCSLFTVGINDIKHRHLFYMIALHLI